LASRVTGAWLLAGMSTTSSLIYRRSSIFACWVLVAGSMSHLKGTAVTEWLAIPAWRCLRVYKYFKMVYLKSSWRHRRALIGAERSSCLAAYGTVATLGLKETCSSIAVWRHSRGGGEGRGATVHGTSIDIVIYDFKYSKFWLRLVYTQRLKKRHLVALKWTTYTYRHSTASRDRLAGWSVILNTRGRTSTYERSHLQYVSVFLSFRPTSPWSNTDVLLTRVIR